MPPLYQCRAQCHEISGDMRDEQSLQAEEARGIDKAAVEAEQRGNRRRSADFGHAHVALRAVPSPRYQGADAGSARYAYTASAGTKQLITMLPRRLTYQTTASPTGLPWLRMTARSGTCHHNPSIGTQ